MRTCSIPGCTARHVARGYCSKHYQRWTTYGNVFAGGKYGNARQTLIDVLAADTEDCVLWPHSLSEGYGQITIDKVRRQVHVVVLERLVGPRPSERYEAAHSCGVRHCVNWRHLRWATGAENQADRLIHGTDCNGEKNPSAKLTEAQVREIRLLSRRGAPQNFMARMFKVTPSAIGCVVRRDTWKSVA